MIISNGGIRMIHVQALNPMKRKFKMLASAVLAILVFGLSVMPAFAATPGKTVNASAKLAYNLKGLHHNLAVQKAYIASKYVYVTQRSGGNWTSVNRLDSQNRENYAI
ncbi:hypothetical protein ACTHSJ_33390 [Paenibacillus cellulositrophicus]|uniref:hypothetical protein n=1 Tax=Paenibacillus cellulositrophicus TaxID=562959 RepID=UPI003F7F2598